MTTTILTPKGAKTVEEINRLREEAVNAGLDPYKVAPTNYSVAAGQGGPTAGEVYKPFVAPASDPAVAGAIDAGIATYGRDVNTPIDENAIRSATLARFQQEVDATNQVYAEKLREAKIQGQSRLGTGAAISARSGTLGSDFGAAQNDRIVGDNTAIEGSIEAEKLAKISSIYNVANTTATNEIAAKRKAQQEGLDSYLKFLGAKTERKTSGLKSIAAAMIAQKLDPTEIAPVELKKIADAYGVSVDELKASYATEKKTAEEAAAKVNLETQKTQAQIDLDKANAEKAGNISLSEGESLYQKQADGSYKFVGKNPKTYAPGGSGTPGGTISRTDAKAYKLPLSVVGKNEKEIVDSLKSSDIPAWFAEKANEEARMSLTPQALGPLWDTYRKKIQLDFESEDDTDSLY